LQPPLPKATHPTDRGADLELHAILQRLHLRVQVSAKFAFTSKLGSDFANIHWLFDLNTQMQTAVNKRAAPTFRMARLSHQFDEQPPFPI
jgi:hypothetical protein